MAADGYCKPFGQKSYDFITLDPALERKYTIMVGSVRSSKTWAQIGKIIAWYSGPKAYQVDGLKVIAGATKGTIYRNLLIHLFRMVGKKNYSYNAATGELWIRGSQWFVVGAKDESSYKNILGMTIGVFIGDEIIEYPASFLKQIFLRMSPDGARFYGSTNPGNPNHYLKVEIIDNPAFWPDLTVIEYTLDDNPNISDDAKRTIKASQSGVFYLRYILGRWVAAEGAIYRDCWKSEYIYTDLTRPRGLHGFGGYKDHVIFCDYGTANPFVLIEGIDDGRRLWCDREFWWDSAKQMRQKTDREYGDDVEKFIAESKVRRRGKPRIVLDPSAASFAVELRARNLWVVDAVNDVADGIRKTASAMTRGFIRLHESCENGKREIPGYMWDDDAVKRGEEIPIKSNDHFCDGLRYGVEEVFQGHRLLVA